MQGEAARSHSFEWFSSLPAYRAMNRAQLEAFLADLDLPAPWRGVDVACGLGLMSDLCYETMAHRGVAPEAMICVDMDPAVLRLARRKLPHLHAYFVQSVGQRLAQRSATAAFAVVGNGIHNFPDEDKVSLLRELARVLQPGGKLFFNSSFFDGAVVPGTERYWLENVRGALRLVARAGRRDSAPPAGLDRKPPAIRVLTPDEYLTLTRDAGFVDVERHEAELRFDQELMEAICDYALYSLGALHFRYPAEVACPAMRQAAHDLFGDPDWERKYPGMVDDGGRRYIPRRVMWVSARKPRAAPSASGGPVRGDVPGDIQRGVGAP